MNYFKKLETIIIWAIILLLGVAYGVLSNNAKAPTNDNAVQQVQNANPESIQQVPASSLVRYNGEEGRTAMDLLKAKYLVQTQSFGDMGEFVKSINGVEPDTTHFWGFYVNGSIAQVGADMYVTKPSDQVEWKLEKIQ